VLETQTHARGCHNAATKWQAQCETLQRELAVACRNASASADSDTAAAELSKTLHLQLQAAYAEVAQVHSDQAALRLQSKASEELTLPRQPSTRRLSASPERRSSRELHSLPTPASEDATKLPRQPPTSKRASLSSERRSTADAGRIIKSPPVPDALPPIRHTPTGGRDSSCEVDPEAAPATHAEAAKPRETQPKAQPKVSPAEIMSDNIKAVLRPVQPVKQGTQPAAAAHLKTKRRTPQKPPDRATMDPCDVELLSFSLVV